MDTATLRRFTRPLVLSVLLGIALYATAMIAGDLTAVTGAAAQLGPAGWTLVLGLSLLNYGLRFVRWHRYLARLGEQVPVWRHTAYYFAGFAFTTTPGKAGEAVRSLYLKRHAVRYSHSLSALFVERLLDLMAVGLLALAAAWAFPGARLPVAVAAGLALGALPLVRHPLLQTTLGALAARLKSTRGRSLLEHVGAMLHASRRLLDARPLYGGLAVGLLAWGAEAAGFWFILDSMGVAVPFTLAVGIYAAGMLAGALSFIPGGLGSTEAVMVLLLGLAGVDAPTALAATLICRIATLWFAVAIGLLAMAGLEVDSIRRGRMKADLGI